MSETLIDYARGLVRTEQQQERLDRVVREYFEALNPEAQLEALAKLEAWLSEHEQGHEPGA